MNRAVWGGWFAVLVVALCACDSTPDVPDAAPGDAATGFDAAPECASAEDCDDGFFCNGEERCREGRCEAGPPPRCDDGIDCTLDRCDEIARACRSSAPDRDGDGFFDQSCRGDDGVPLGRDCDDEDINRFPGNIERCDTEDHDEDCDPTTFGAVDDDGDGEPAARCCNVADDGTRACGVDCDDTRAGVNNRVPEVCNGLDDDCDGNVDEGVLIAGFIDADFDGRGDDSRPTESCGAQPGVAELGGDCDDSDPTVREGGPELCDMVDNDCDGTTDESPVVVDWYRDLDGDGFGASASGVIENCAPQPGHSILSLDCNDEDAGVNPGQAELCNGVDDNCNGVADFAIGVNDFEDDDEDGLVDLACGGPLAVDCDDSDPRTGAGEAEVCDGRDNDCDGNVDEGATDAVFYRDLDGDGWGSVTSGSMVSCSPVAGFVTRGGDCNDASPSISPDGNESCNGLDDDCNGAVDDGSALTTCALANTSLALCDRGRCLVETCADGFADCNADPEDGCEMRVDEATACGCELRNCTDSFNASGGVCVPKAGTHEYTCEPTCLTGFGDCDGIPDNGCEADLRFDVAHCGSCSRVCPATDGRVPLCSDGECGLECAPGFGDCDPDAAGCETALNTPENCGGCDAPCTLGDGVETAICVPDLGTHRCEVAQCEPLRADCDRDFVNGCEVDTQTDRNHCGGCGIGCGPDAVCFEGGCRLECPPNHANCDGRTDNGCETPTASNDAHCGGCDRACGSSAHCIDGVCCGQGRADCDPGVAGCETDTDWDDAHCGECGNICPSGSVCERGVCRLQCSVGTADCDPGAPGCETPLGTDMNCGGCDDFCTDGRSCVDRRCECAAPMADCDPTTPACETNVEDDPQHCGMCHHPCPTGHTCFAGSCVAPTQLVTGADFSCALLSDHTVWCWGSDARGQLGRGPGDDSSFTPDPVPGLDNVLMLAAGEMHACALRGDGTVWCWGDNMLMQSGCPSPVSGTCPSPSLVSVTSDMQATFIAAEGGRSCAISRGMPDRLTCWGDGWADVGVDISQLPTPPQSVALGADFGCVKTTSSEVLCWGSNSQGQLGDGTTMQRARPDALVNVPGGVAQLAAGAEHACAISHAGELYCWGDGSVGQNGQLGDVSVPTLVSAGYVRATALGTSAQGTCITRSPTDDLVCMGADGSEELGNGASMTFVSSLTSVLFSGTVRIFGVTRSADANAVCALDDQQRMFCWGNNAHGQLGTAPGTPVATPQQVVR